MGNQEDRYSQIIMLWSELYMVQEYSVWDLQSWIFELRLISKYNIVSYYSVRRKEIYKFLWWQGCFKNDKKNWSSIAFFLKTFLNPIQYTL